MPDQKWHRRISFIKSGIRIAGYVLIPFNLIGATVESQFLSEVVRNCRRISMKKIWRLWTRALGAPLKKLNEENKKATC